MPAKGQRNGYTKNCEWCGKEVYKTKTQYNRNKHHFCSNSCQMKWNHSQVYEMRPCELCGIKFEVRKTSTQKLCSVEWQKKWQKTRTGFLNPKFEGGTKLCAWCGKKYIAGKYKMNSESNRFCCIGCKRAWFANVWSQQDSWKEESRKRAATLLKNNKVITNTSIQIMVNQILDSMKISYENEKVFDFYSVDNYLLESNLIIEVMGDYWHCSPLKFFKVESPIHRRSVRRDKAKRTFILNKYGIKILNLWEYDILNRTEVCRYLIEKYITAHGKIENYNSFNYTLYECNNLILNRDIMYPYFEENRLQLVS